MVTPAPDSVRLDGTAFALRDPLAWRSFATLVRDGEALGYSAVFLPEVSGAGITGRDTLVALGTVAGETRELLLGTGVLPMGSRTARLTAMAAAAVAERSDGRLLLGLGTGPAVPGALDRLRDLVVTLRRLFAGETVEVEGRARRLSLVPDRPIPLWIAALGPRAVRLAGEIADGVLLNWCSPERVHAARSEVASSAEAAGRDPLGVTIGVYVRACLIPDVRSAMRALQAATGEYASYPAYARQFASMGLEAEARAAAAAHRAGRPDNVQEALVRAVCLSGDPAEARARLEAYVEAGADLPVVYPVSVPDGPVRSIRSTLEWLAPRR